MGRAEPFRVLAQFENVEVEWRFHSEAKAREGFALACAKEWESCVTMFLQAREKRRWVTLDEQAVAPVVKHA